VNSGDHDIPTRSADGLAALDVFYQEFNDINFYVEDEDQENLYEIILKKLFPTTKIARIFPLGGKCAVLNHALSDSNLQITAYRAYLVDKDFDDLLGTQLHHPNVFYLDRFCIENFLTEERAALEVVIENHPKKRRDELSAHLKLDEVIDGCYTSLRPLFALFFGVQHLKVPMKNCSIAPEAFCDPRRLWELKPDVLEAYRQELVAQSQAAGIEPPINDPLADPRLRPAVEAPTHVVVSGKYVAAQLFHFIKSNYSLGSMTFDSFIYRLAKNCALDSLNGLGQRISAAALAFRTSAPSPQAVDA